MAVHDHAPAADEEQLVEEAKTTGIHVGDERVERDRIDVLGLRRGSGPRLTRPPGRSRRRARAATTRDAVTQSHRPVDVIRASCAWDECILSFGLTICTSLIMLNRVMSL